MKNHSVEFATSCYEKDWEFLLKTRRLRDMITACRYSFDRVTLYLNNINDYEQAVAYAKKHQQEGIITDYVIISDYEKEVLDFYQINDKRSLYYLIQCLTMLYLTPCDYLLHFTCDAILTTPHPWIEQAIRLMESRQDIMVANALNQVEEKLILREAFDDTEDFYLSYGFSDQCALMKTAVYKQPIYNEKSEFARFYPERGRCCFEERVYSYMRNHKKYRITHKLARYRHKNFPKNQLKKWLTLHTPFNNQKYGIGK